MKFAGKLQPFTSAFRDAYGEGREEWAKAYREGRKAVGNAENAPRIDEMTGAYPTGIRIKELVDDVRGKKLSREEINNRQIRSDLGIGPKSGVLPRTGQMLGTIAADLTQDNTRNFYWLLNAAQATGNVIAEKALGTANPQLYGKSYLRNPDTNKVYNRKDEYLPSEYMSGDTPKKGVSFDEEGNLMKRNYNPGDLAALMIPTGVAINTGLGLLTPFGGAEGYKAAVPSQEDPTKTDNVIAEVAAKYFLGKTGNLLPYSEFKEVRPDVSPEEYAAYSAFKYDNRMDLNPFDDGQVVAPAGILKYTNEGIHGPEVQFLGRSLPVTTGLIPFATALAGGAVGVKSGRPIRGGLLGGLTGLAVGQIGGQLLEQERRRRNTIENQMQNPQY